MKTLRKIFTRPTDSGRHYFGRPLGLAIIVLYKVVWGLMEMISGVLLIFSYNLIYGELTEDPQDLLANWIISNFHVSQTDTVYLGSIVVGLGLAKLLLAGFLWWRVAFVRELGLVFFGAFAIYGTYHLAFHFSPLTVLGLAMDILAFCYFWSVLPKHLSKNMLYE